MKRINRLKARLQDLQDFRNEVMKLYDQVDKLKLGVAIVATNDSIAMGLLSYVMSEIESVEVQIKLLEEKK